MRYKIFLSIFFFIAVAFFFFTLRTNLIKVREDFLLQKDTIQNWNKILSEYIHLNSIPIKHKLSNIRLTSEEAKVVSLNEIVQSKPMLILFLNEKYCESCQISALEQLGRTSKEIGYENIVILSSYTNFTHLLALKSNLDSRLRAFNIPETEQFPEQLVKLNSVCYFIISSELTISAIMLHKLTDIQITQIYLSAVSSVLNKGNEP